MPDDAALLELAVAQGGVFTVSQAKDCGWTHHAIRSALADKRWQRLYPGVLVQQAWYASLDPAARHLVQLRARLLQLDRSWHAARRTAALVHGLPIIGKPPAVPQLVRDKTVLSLRGSNRHERISTLPEHERDHREVPVTSLARTVADLARAECFRNAVVVADGALRAGADPGELLHVATRCAGWPGGAATRSVVLFADARAETPLESISRVAFRQLALPTPELQLEVWDCGEFVARVDFLWRASNVVGEADGRSKYATVEDLYREKRREERLRNLGFEVVRWDWDTAYRAGPDLASAVRRALARGALNTLAPGVRLVRSGLPSAA